jgi:hypothetical protein
MHLFSVVLADYFSAKAFKNDKRINNSGTDQKTKEDRAKHHSLLC